MVQWLKSLYQAGVEVNEDTVFVSQESARLLRDQEYRKEIYPVRYTWEAAAAFIKRQELQKAFWFFINLYLVNDKYKEMVVKSIVTYDKLFKMERILVSTFYTYSLTDPELGSLSPHSAITAPHVMEKKLNALKEMLFYLDKYKQVPDKSGN